MGTIVVVVLIVLVSAITNHSVTPTTSTSPTNWDLPKLSGTGRIKLSDFHGKPTVVNLFASWCTECKIELPGFAKLANELKGKVNFVFVNSLENGDGMAMTRAFHIDPQPIARDQGGQDGSGLHDAIGATGLPLTIYYDANGKIINTVNFTQTEQELHAKLQQDYGITAP